MNTTTRKTSIWLIAGLFGLVLLTTLACSLGGLTIGKNGAVVDVTLSQDEVNTLLQNATVQNENPRGLLFDKITSVEMLDGFMRVHGTAADASGTEVEGSYDVSVSVKDDILVVQIIAVDIPGVELTDPRVVKANQEMADDLTKSVTESNGEVLYKEASVKDGVLNIKVQVNFKTK